MNLEQRAREIEELFPVSPREAKELARREAVKVLEGKIKALKSSRFYKDPNDLITQLQAQLKELKEAGE